MTRSQRAFVAALLALALLAAQALGLEHRVAHGPGAKGAHSHSHSHSHSALHARQAPDRAHDHVHVREHLHVHAAADDACAALAHAGPTAFDTHEPGSPECRLVDQATHLDVLLATAAAAMLPRVPHVRPCAAGEDARTAGFSAYLARAPPGSAGASHAA